MNSRLAIKAAENKERRDKEQLLRTLPQRWIELVANAPTLNSWEFLDQFPVDLNYDLRTQPLLDKKSVTFADFDHLDFVKAYLKKSEMVLSPRVICWFGVGPAFIVESKIELKWLSELTKLSDFRVYLAESDFCKGVICSEYLGVLDDQRSTNGNESVYEIMSFE